MNAERGQLTKSEANDAAYKPSFTRKKRQLSNPNAKPPMGPRPLDMPAGKRFVANAPVPLVPACAKASQYRSISQSTASQSELDDSTRAATAHEQAAEQFSINIVSRFNFTSIVPQNSPPHEGAQADLDQKDSLGFGDFLPPINFDDFHNSITTDEPSLSHFPLPGRGSSSLLRPLDENKTLLPQPINPPLSTRVLFSS